MIMAATASAAALAERKAKAQRRAIDRAKEKRRIESMKEAVAKRQEIHQRALEILKRERRISAKCQQCFSGR